MYICLWDMSEIWAGVEEDTVERGRVGGGRSLSTVVAPGYG